MHSLEILGAGGTSGVSGWHCYYDSLNNTPENEHTGEKEICKFSQS